MLNTTVIQRLSNKLQTTEQNIRREYMQHLFLSYFYQYPTTQEIFFKGGTALRIAYNSPRFSEDMDFSSLSANIQSKEDAVLNTLKEIQQEGIQTEIIESKPTSGGYIGTFHFTFLDQTTSIQIEISSREGEKTGEIMAIVNNFVPPYNLMTLSPHQLVEEKVKALLSRQKPRDFYDLYFILRANLLDPEEKKILPEVLHILHKSKIHFESELKQFLPINQWAIIRDFKSVLEREIGRVV